MNKKILVLTLTFVLLCSVVPLVVIPVNAADITTEVTVTKLANDGTTVLDQVTVTVEEMMADSAELPVYGDGVTHYYFQGPSFDPANLWDQTELVNVDSRDYGACMGTDVKDLCEMLSGGGASAGDEIEIKAPDGFSKMFAYEDVYTPEPEQGKLIVTWYTAGSAEGDEGYVTDDTYTDGMRLIFFAETLNPDGKHVFGTWDMHETLAEEYWHYYYDSGSGILYPSSSGLSVKWVSDIIIYSSEEPPVPETWSLTLSGADTYVMNQTEFEGGVDHHEATWVDGEDTWSGISLWRLVGWVDDDVQHGEGAFNDGLATAGYDIQIIASDGYSKTFASAAVARNDNMIIANTLNGEELSDSYPLRLVGPDLSGGQKVGMITEIQLLNLPKGEASSSLNATANVTIEMVGIDLDRDSIDYGDVVPGESSAVEAVGIDNIGTLDCDVTLEVVGADGVAQSFYEQSLYIDSGLYNADAVIANIPVEESQSVDTQLQVPLSWAEGTGAQDATFIFWATASD
jgi:hypothetical protein